MQESTSSGAKTVWIIVGVVIAILCCCLIILAGAGYWVYQNGDDLVSSIDDSLGIPATPTPGGPIIVDRTPVDEIPTDTLTTLENTIVPANNLPEISCRLKGVCEIPLTLKEHESPRKVSDTDTFWATNVSTNENFEVDATLQYVTAHSYFWVQDGIEFKEDFVFVLLSSLFLKKTKTSSPMKATIKEENNITYLKASCRSITEDDSISVVNINEKINTPILPIDAATIPLPPSKKPNALP